MWKFLQVAFNWPVIIDPSSICSLIFLVIWNQKLTTWDNLTIIHFLARVTIWESPALIELHPFCFIICDIIINCNKLISKIYSFLYKMQSTFIYNNIVIFVICFNEIYIFFWVLFWALTISNKFKIIVLGWWSLNQRWLYQFFLF